MANIFLDADELFTLADDASVFGRGGGNEGIAIQSGVTGVTLDGNIERIDVAASAADTTFQVNADNQLEIVVDGQVVATAGSLNQPADVRFTDGNVTLSPSGVGAFEIADPADDTNSATIEDGTPQTGDAVNLGGDTSSVGDGQQPGGGDGQTFTLTTGVDLQQDFTGGPGDDVFIADDSGDDVAGPADELFGEGGNDTLRIFESGGTLPGTVDSIETVQLNLTDTDLDLSGLTDTTAVEIVQDSGANTYTFNENQSVTVQNTTLDDDAADDLVLTFAAAATSAAVTLDGVSSAGTNSDLSIAGSGLTSLDITAANNDSTVTELSTPNGITSLTVDGGAALELTDDLNANILTVDATANSGGVTISSGDADTTASGGVSFTSGSGEDTLDLSAIATNDLSNATADLTVEAGQGDDTVNVGDLLNNVVADATFTVDGGDGQDVLAVSNTFSSEVSASDVDTFETLRLDGAGSYDLEGFGFGNVIANADLGGNTLTVDEGVGVEIQVDQTGTVTIDQVGAGAAGSLDDSVDLTLNTDGSGSFNDLTVDDVETVNITSTTSADDPSAETNTATLNADSLGTIDVGGDTELDLTVGNQVDLVNAGDHTGGLTIDLSANNTAAASVTTGSGGDTITTSGFDDVVDAGAGEDTVNVTGHATGGSTATVTVSTGADADEVDHNAGTGLLRSVVDDFSFGSDQLGSDDDDFAAGGITDASEAATFVNNVLGAGTAASGDIEFLEAGTGTNSAVFEFDGATHIVGSGADQSFDAGEVFISLQGVTGLESGDVADLFA
jgi:hypothetical protein